MKTKELLEYLDNDDISYLLKLSELTDIKIAKILNYYEGNLNGLVNINNNNYLFIWTDNDRSDTRVYIVIDSKEEDYKSFVELFNKDLEIIGYFKQ